MALEGGAAHLVEQGFCNTKSELDEDSSKKRIIDDKKGK